MKSGVWGKIFIVLVSGVVLASVIGGLWLLGPISEQRAKKFDTRRVAELQNIQRSVDHYWTSHESLPSNLAALSKEPGVSIAVNDPATGWPYTYRITGEESFELCAVFATKSSGQTGLWSHGRGLHCFKSKARRVGR